MNTQTNVMVTAASLTPGDVVVFGDELAVIVENRENTAWKGLQYITYRYLGDEAIAAGFNTGTYRPTEMMEKIK